MLYAIIGRDAPDSLTLRASVRAEHLKRLEELRDEGRLVLAGPFPAIDGEEPADAGFLGSLIVADFPCLESAQSWTDADPYCAAGVYAETEVLPFKKVLP